MYSVGYKGFDINTYSSFILIMEWILFLFNEKHVFFHISIMSLSRRDCLNFLCLRNNVFLFINNEVVTLTDSNLNKIHTFPVSYPNQNTNNPRIFVTYWLNGHIYLKGKRDGGLYEFDFLTTNCLITYKPLFISVINGCIELENADFNPTKF